MAAGRVGLAEFAEDDMAGTVDMADIVHHTVAGRRVEGPDVLEGDNLGREAAAAGDTGRRRADVEVVDAVDAVDVAATVPVAAGLLGSRGE
jgi:hypothetical protein